MNRTIKNVEDDIQRLCKQIQATLDSKMSAKDKRITLQGFAQQKAKLDAEKQRLHDGVQERVFNCKVGKIVPVPYSTFNPAFSEPANTIEQR